MTEYFLSVDSVCSVGTSWLPWVWPTFNQIFLMMFMSAWLRRSNVLTGAQWMQTRFGNDRGAISLLAIASLYLKFSWYDRLEKA